MREFLSRTDEFSQALSKFERHDNSMLFKCVDELILRRAADEPGPDRLAAPAMGKWEPFADDEPAPKPTADAPAD